MVKRYLDGHVLGWFGKGPLGIPFSSYALRHDGVTVWIDAIDPGAGRDAVLALGPPQHLLITFGDHDRDVLALARQYGAEVWVPAGEAPAFPHPDHVITDGTELPAGLKAMALPGVGYGETALYGEVAGKRIAFIGDAVLNLRMSAVERLLSLPILAHGRGPFQRKRLFRGGDTAQALKSILKLLDLDLDAAFFSHGDPVEHDAGRKLRESITTW